MSTPLNTPASPPAGTASAAPPAATSAPSARNVDPFGAQTVRRATREHPLLARFNAAGVLAAADVHVAARLGALCGERDERVLLAVALAVCAVRTGSVCTTLEDAPALSDAVRTAEGVPDQSRVDQSRADGDDAAGTDLPWPELEGWRAAVVGSPMVSVGPDGPEGPDRPEGPKDRPVRWVDGRIYLDRYWRHEQVVRTEVDARLSSAAASAADPAVVDAVVQQLFPHEDDERQRLAAATAVRSRITVLTGGPGTGKTTTVARIVAAVQTAAGPGLRVALAAPTGKAATRLQEAVNEELTRLDPAHRARVGELRASTLHRLLGRRPGSSTRFWHDAQQRLPHDLVVVDESSMVSLPLMAGLLQALRPSARLVLVGDPDQLASVEAGAVLGDLVARPEVPGPIPENGVVRLTRTHRFSGALGDLAEAVRTADPDRVLELLRAGTPEVDFVETSDDAARPDLSGLHGLTGLTGLQQDVVSAGVAMSEAALNGDPARALEALGRHRLLLAHRRGPFGVSVWSAQAASWVASATGIDPRQAWPPGLPVIVGQNDAATGLSNGDTGVVVLDPDAGDGVLVAFGEPGALRLVRPHRLPEVQPVHAMTIHRAQGSQFDRVSVVLPPSSSPLLTRELFYTAVTRAKRSVRVVGSQQAVRLAVHRPIRRASGLRFPL